MSRDLAELRDVFSDWEQPVFALGESVIVQPEGERARIVAYYAWNKPMLLYGVMPVGGGEAKYVSFMDLKRETQKHGR